VTFAIFCSKMSFVFFRLSAGGAKRNPLHRRSQRSRRRNSRRLEPINITSQRVRSWNLLAASSVDSARTYRCRAPLRPQHAGFELLTPDKREEPHSLRRAIAPLLHYSITPRSLTPPAFCSANHFPELFLVQNLDPQLACFNQLASRILTGEQIVGLFAHA
jgi:hypothetical protein